MDKEISVYDNSISARIYLSYIAEQAGGIAIIGRDGKLYIKTFGESVVEVSLNRFKDFKWGEKFKITRVYYEDGVQRFEQGDTTENTVYISQDNMYIVDQEQIDNIYNKVKDLEVYSFEGTTIIDPAIDVGDILLIDGKKVIYQGSSEYSGHLIATISSKIQCKAKEELTTRVPSQTAINRKVQAQINQAEGKITMLSGSVTEANEKIAQMEITDNSIKQNVSEINTTIANDVATKTALATEIATLSNSVNIKIEASETETKKVGDEVKTLKENVKDMSYNFSTKGLQIGSSQDSNNSVYDNKGIRVYNYDNLQSIFNFKGSGIDKLIVTGTAQIGRLRIMKSTKDGEPVTKVFHLKNLIEDLKDLEV